MQDDRIPSVTESVALWTQAHRRVVAWCAAGILSTATLLVAGAAGAANDPAPPPPTPTATATATPTHTFTPTWTATPTATHTFTPTFTPVPPTSTPVPPTPAPRVVAPPTSTPHPPPPPPLPPPAPAAPALSPIGMDPYAAALFQATNARRASVGLPPLRENGYLNAIARLRSQEMAQYNYFSHDSPITGLNVFGLMDQYGVPFGYAGENLAKNNYPDNETVAVADQALWDSPGHHANIVNVHYTQVGIALVVDGTGMKYFTVVFTD